MHIVITPLWYGDRKIGDSTHRRGVVEMTEFERRFASNVRCRRR
jgi:predicted thioesterase